MIDHSTIRPAQRAALILALMTSTFMAAIEVTVIATVMPSLVSKLGGFELFSWAFSIYLLAQGVMTPIYGRLADLFGRKRTYIGACLTFLAGSALCGFAWSMPSLIVFRAVQGLGAGGMSPIASTIMADISAPHRRARAVGFISAIYGIAAVLGPLVGAALVDFGWQWVFWINIPFGALAVGLVARFLTEKLERHGHGVDLPGAGLLLLGAGAMMLLLTQHATLSAAAAIGCGVVGVATLAALARHQATAPEPLIPRHFWRNPIIILGVSFSLMSGAWSIAFSAFLPTFVQGVRGGTPLDGGLALAWMSLAWTLGSLLAGRIVGHFRYKLTALVGGALVVVGSAVLATLHQGQDPMWLRGGSIVGGLGMGAVNLTFTVAIQSAVAWGDRGRATSFYFFSRILGQALGAAAFGGLLNAGLGVGGGADPVRELMEPARRALLAPGAIADFVNTLDSALHGVWVAVGLVAVAMFVLTVLLPPRERLAE